MGEIELEFKRRVEEKLRKEERKREREMLKNAPMKEILEQGLAIVAPHTASTAPTPRHDRHKEKREKKERKKVIVEDRGLGKSVNLDNIFSSMDKIAPIEKKKKKKKKKDKEKEEDS